MTIQFLPARHPAAPYVVSFDEIVKARFAIDHAADSEDDPSDQQEELNQLWSKFAEQEEGKIVSSFFGRLGETGAALSIGAGHPHLCVALDLPTADSAADLVSRYERLRVKADQLLKGEEREHMTRLLYDRICGVIRIVDQIIALQQLKNETRFDTLAEVFADNGSTATSAIATPSDDGKQKSSRRGELADAPKRIAKALAIAEKEAEQAEALCDRAVRRGAMMAYFMGMLIGIVVFSGLGVLLSVLLSNVDIEGFSVEFFLTVFIAGALGAVVSVMTRMSSGDSWLEFETARSYLRVLGMFRPLIGAIFGVALYFGIHSGVLQFIQPPKTTNGNFFFYAFIAFLAGFSERWASDILVPITNHASTAKPAVISQQGSAS